MGVVGSGVSGLFGRNVTVSNRPAGVEVSACLRRRFDICREPVFTDAADLVPDPPNLQVSGPAS